MGPGFKELRFGGARPHQGLGAEAIAAKWGLSRTQLDEFSLRSHAKAAAAADAGFFDAQIIPVTTPEEQLSPRTRASGVAAPWKSWPASSRPSPRTA